MAINRTTLERRGYTVEEIPGLGAPKTPMWKQETMDGELVWIRVGPFPAAMVPVLQAKGFVLTPPPASPVVEEADEPLKLYVCKYCGENFEKQGQRLAHYRKCEGKVTKGVNQ